MSVLQILLLIVLIPIGAYLREQTCRNVHGNATIGRDLRNLIQSVKQWMERRAYRKELKRKYGHLNKPKK